LLLYIQTRLCDTCQELSEAHLYYYAHHDKQLTIQVKQLPPGIVLAGEAERRIWMWSRCGKCNSCSTDRVLISTTARSLSFGKYLELSLSHYSSSRKSRCGHSIDKDFLYFFGYFYLHATFYTKICNTVILCLRHLTHPSYYFNIKRNGFKFFTVEIFS
jgi:1-phosphatidylinositol-3-phosphate 5-kinase